MKCAKSIWAVGTAWFLVCPSSYAEEHVAVVDDFNSAWVSDGADQTNGQEIPYPPAEEVARELYQLQQQMGGSIVTRADQPEVWNRTPGDLPSPLRRAELAPPMQNSPPSAYLNQPPSPIGILRETVWQLETSAHRLESLDLYAQADALRQVADQLRKDARKLKKQANDSLH